MKQRECKSTELYIFSYTYILMSQAKTVIKVVRFPFSLIRGKSEPNR